MNKKIQRQSSAFSLIEMSVVILIISIIASGALTIAKTSMKNANIRITKERMETIYKAITNYLALNKKLPCPASLEKDNTDIDFGKSQGSDGNCAFAGVLNVGNLSWGMVPTATLGLSNDIASDGFGTKFEYIVDKRFTRKTASIIETDGSLDPVGFEGNAGYQPPNTTLPVIIDIREGSATGTSLTNFAIMVIMSHGPNKLGGYNATGTIQNTHTGATADEIENVRTGSFNKVFVNNSTNQNFDDILLYKRKTDLIPDAGLEFILCPKSESYYYVSPTKTLYWNSAYYDGTTQLEGNEKCNNDKIFRMCGKHGIWTTASGC